MSFKWGEKEQVMRNRKVWLESLGISYKDCVFASLVSGTDLKEVANSDKGNEVVCDALVTGEPQIALCMVTADCLPVIFYDADTPLISLVHLGWRGVDGKLAADTAKVMERRGASLSGVKVWIGPGVRKESYIKYGEKLDFFLKTIAPHREEWEPFLVKTATPGHIGLDLVGYVKKQLTDVGIREDNIKTSDTDTLIDTDYFSHYRSGENGETEGRFATVVMMKEEERAR